MTFNLSQRSLDKLEGVDERLVAVVKHAITVTKKRLWRLYAGCELLKSSASWWPRAQARP
jgi:hypothetical protein